jgi:NADH-quinone oxidoreductase subunit M
MLAWILFIPFAGGLVAWLSGRASEKAPRFVALAALCVDFLLVVSIWPLAGETGRPWLSELQAPWLPSFGISFHLAADGVSLSLVALACFLGIMAVGASWTEIRERPGFFHLNLLFTIVGVIGVFFALDLFLFYFFWELMLVPMYFLIVLWGHDKRLVAAVKFVIFTQLSGLLMLGAILGLVLHHGASTGIYTFSYTDLLATDIPPTLSFMLILGFLSAFLVKLPSVPFHTWLPDAHTQAPTAGSVILAGLMLKTGGYGIFRFAVPLFPSAADQLFIPLGVLAVAGIIYGAVLASVQSDVKRLIAYTSVSHMGFVLLGLVAGNEIALHGVFVQMVSHGLCTGGLFVIAGLLQERTGTRELSRMGGLWSQAPRMGGVALVFGFALLGLPGMGTFIGEILILIGMFRSNPALSLIASSAFIFSTVYSLRLIQQVFFGTNRGGWKLHDLCLREAVILFVMLVPLLWLGIYPQPFLKVVGHSFQSVPGKTAASWQGTADTLTPSNRRGVPR